MEDEEELLLLRINALKSAKSKSNKLSLTQKNAETEQSHDEEEAILRQVALDSVNKDVDIEIHNNEIQENRENEEEELFLEPQENGDKNVEELSLREKALKTLLKKRVAKTEKLIKEAIQHEMVTSTSNNVPKKKQTPSTETPPETSTTVKKKPFRNPNLLKSTELRNFLPDNTRDISNVKSEEEACTSERLDSVHIGSDDELSICASDEDENTDETQKRKDPTKRLPEKEEEVAIQCNIISSCCEKETAKSSPDEGEQLEEVKTVSTHAEDNVFEERPAEEDSIVVDEQIPGPSGYQKPIPDESTDSDASVVEVKEPEKKQPRVLSLVTDSSSEEDTTGKGKKKIKKKKKKTVKERLSKQEGILDGDREDLKDLMCSVCLGPYENRTFLKECFHSFCQICIMQWSELSRLCPLCKTFYQTLIHSVTRDLEFEEYTFPKKVSKKTSSVPRNEFSEVMGDGRRFRYSSTIIDHETWTSRRQDRERAEAQRAQGREQRKINRRLKWSATKDRRKAVYKLKMFIKEVKQRGRNLTRDISPKFFNDNPAIKHRLVPWLLRDLNVLLGNDDEMIRFVMSLILNLISKIPMDGIAFKEQLHGFLYDKTDQFVDELVSFAKSPYDIRGYDDNVVYDVRPAVIELDAEGESVQDRILHEVFLGDQQDVPILTNETPAEGKSPSVSDGEGTQSVDENSRSSMQSILRTQNGMIKKRTLSENEKSLFIKDNVVETSKHCPMNDATSLERCGVSLERQQILQNLNKRMGENPRRNSENLSQNESESGESEKENNEKKIKGKMKKKKKTKKSTRHELVKSENESENGDIKQIDERERKRKQKKRKRSRIYGKDSEDIIENENGIEVNESESKFKSKKRKKKKKHKRKLNDLVESGEGDHYDGDLGEHNDAYERKKHKKLKHSELHHNGELIAGSNSKVFNEELEVKDKRESDSNNNSKTDINEISTKLRKKQGTCSDRLHSAIRNESEDDKISSERESRKRVLSSSEDNNLKEKRRKRKKKKEKRKDDVTKRLYRFLGSTSSPSSKQTRNISLLNEQLQKYVNTHHDELQKNKTLKTQSEIISELLGVEKALLRSHRKKEIVRLKEKQQGLEEMRSKRRRAGDANYTEHDEEIYEIDDQLESLNRQIDEEND